MNKRWAVAGAVATIVSIGVGSVTGAEPKPTDKNVELFECERVDNPPPPFGSPPVPVEIVTAGGSRIGYIGGQKYKAVSVEVNSPTGEPLFTKVWGGGKDLDDPDAITCTQTFPEGTVTLIAVPA